MQKYLVVQVFLFALFQFKLMNILLQVTWSNLWLALTIVGSHISLALDTCLRSVFSCFMLSGFACLTGLLVENSVSYR